jgi:alanine dehydrogenase
MKEENMLIGIPKEIKNNEYRVGLAPSSVREFESHGHDLIVEKDAGAAIGFTDNQYGAAGATIVDTADEIFARADMIIKVKEPQPEECGRLREGQILFTYLHLAPDPKQTEMLLESGATCIAYETVTDDQGGLPLLAPMSEVAGRMSIQAGAHYLEKPQGGRGVLLGGIPGVAPAKVTVIGGGVVGDNAAYMAVGMGANVTILDRSVQRLRQLDIEYLGRVNCVYSTITTIEEHVLESDLVIGAVLIPGASAPKLLTREIISRMRSGSVVVDVAIDQGGCFETSKPTTHEDPVYIVDDVIHYCVANMPGAVARTSTMGLNNVTLPFALDIANKGVVQALQDDIHLANGLSVCAGKVTYQAVADALGYEYVEPMTALAGQDG